MTTFQSCSMLSYLTWYINIPGGKQAMFWQKSLGAHETWLHVAGQPHAVTFSDKHLKHGYMWLTSHMQPHLYFSVNRPEMWLHVAHQPHADTFWALRSNSQITWNVATCGSPATCSHISGAPPEMWLHVAHEPHLTIFSESTWNVAACGSPATCSHILGAPVKWSEQPEMWLHVAGEPHAATFENSAQAKKKAKCGCMWLVSHIFHFFLWSAWNMAGSPPGITVPIQRRADRESVRMLYHRGFYL